MKLSVSRLALVGLTGLSLASATAQAQTTPDKPFFFRDGDRALILGDSITEQRQYSTLVESYVLSRFPQWNITFRNSGWGGDTMGFAKRVNQEKGFARDIAPLAPTAVTIDFGMNDARRGEAGYNDYVNNSKTLADRFAAIGTRVAFVTSSPEEKFQEGQPAGSAYNTMLRRYSDGLKEVAAEKNTLFLDQLNPMIKTIEDGRAGGVLAPKEGGDRLIPDGVHGNWAGHMVMAAHILKGLNAPSLVSSVEIDVPTKGRKITIKNSQNAQAALLPDKLPLLNDLPNIGNLFPRRIAFNRTDAALPWPLHGGTALALKIPGFTPLDDLSRYELKVNNLSHPKYELAIDSQTIGTYTKEELAAGVNLAGVTTGPIYAQTQQLLQKITDKNNLYFNRWRNVQLYDAPKWLATDVETARATEIARIDGLIVAAEKEINELRQPKQRLWTLVPVQ